jgi:hypothetical protein
MGTTWIQCFGREQTAEHVLIITLPNSLLHSYKIIDAKKQVEQKIATIKATEKQFTIVLFICITDKKKRFTYIIL